MKVYIVTKADGYCTIVDKVFLTLEKALEYIAVEGGNWDEYDVS